MYERVCGKWYRRRDNTGLIRAHSSHNPFLPAEYVDITGGHMSAALRAQELAGEFVDAIGLLFQREWFMPLVREDEIPFEGQRVRYWDRASSTGQAACYTAGVLMVRDRQGVFWVEDVVRGRWTYEVRNQKILDTARKDAARYGNTVQIYGEQEGGSAGKEVTEQFIKMLAGFPVHRDVVTGKGTKLLQGMELPNKPKIIRAQGLIAQAEARNVRVKSAPWTIDFLDELIQFPLSDICDQVDACAGSLNKLCRMWTTDPGWTGRLPTEAHGERFGIHLDQTHGGGARRR
jgi:predicted phage terminase large subunit-like protein